MTTLHDLLEHAAGDSLGLDIDHAGDLRRGHRALTGRRARWAAGATGGLAVAGVLGHLAVPGLQDAPTTLQPESGSSTSTPSPDPTQYYDVPTPPAGWHLVGERPQYALLGRDGSNSDMDTFAGHIVLLLVDGAEDFTQPASIQLDGHTVYVNEENSDATILSTRDGSGDWLQVQYPKGDLGVREMAGFLTGTRVKPDASPGSS
jgi:hypothetical protein